MVEELEFRKVKALEDIEKILFDYSKMHQRVLEDIVDYMRRMDGMMQTLLQTLERLESDVSP